MWIVDRQLNGVRSLSPEEMALIGAYVENRVSGMDVIRSSGILREIRASNHWLLCGCCKPAPVMHIALLDTGRFVLRNNPDGHEHAAGCGFAKEIAKSTNTSNAVVPVVTRVPADVHFAPHAEFSGASKGLPSQISRSAPFSAPKKKVLSLLMTLIEMAGLNRYDPASPGDMSEQFKALRKAADALTLHPGIPLGRFFDSRINKARLYGLARRLRDTDDFKGGRKVGILMDTIAGIHGREILLGEDELLGFFGHVERNHATTNPSLALATVSTQQAGSRFYELGQVATVPVASRRTMFPIAAGENRDDVMQILNLLDWMCRKEVPVVAVRHLFSDETNGLIELRSRNQIITLNMLDTAPLPSPDGEDDIEADLLVRARYKDIDSMKRHIAKTFLEQAGRGK